MLIPKEGSRGYHDLDDCEEYEASRGEFYPPNAKDHMKGYHIYNIKELEKLCVI